MSTPTNTFTSLNQALTIDPVNDWLGIDTLSVGATQKINRNTLLNLTSQPVGLSDNQTLTNKTLTAPTLASPTLSGTVAGTFSLPSTTTFPSSVATLTDSQTLTNKTLTSPTINNPSITNATLTADAITGYTVSNTGSIYGISVTTGTIGSAALANNSILNAAIATGNLYASKFYNPYKFSVYRNSAANITTSPTLITYDTEIFDTGSNYSVSTGKFTVPVSGFYQINVGGSITYGGGNANVNIYIYKNGSQLNVFNGLQIGGTQANQTQAITKLLQLSANDYLQIYMGNSAGTLSLNTGLAENWFEGFLVSAT